MRSKVKGTWAIVIALVVLFTAMINPKIAAFLAVFVLAAFGVYCFVMGDEPAVSASAPAENPQKAKERQEHLKIILELTKVKGSVSNREIALALGVSEATASSCLKELEMQGKLTQIGNSGSYVIYNL
jgi:uncharacterized membrane protein